MGKPKEARIHALMEALGFSRGESSEYDSIIANHPTVEAFAAGEITFRQAVWVETYLSNGFDERSATYAVYNPGSPAAAGVHAYRLKNNEKLRKLIMVRVEMKAMTPPEVLAEYAKVATASMEPFLNINENGTASIDLRKALNHGAIGLLKKFKVNQDGSMVIELRDQDNALNQLAKVLGMFETHNLQRLSPEMAAIAAMPRDEKDKMLREMFSDLKGDGTDDFDDD